VGEVVGWLSERYREVELLGQGGMGLVLAVLDPARGRLAVKVLHADPLAEPDKLARFQREAEVLSGLAHPGVVRFLGFEREPRPHFIMELVEGEPFGEFLAREAPLPVPRCLELTRQLLEILAAVHAHDVVHRDLKPSNLLLTPGQELKLLDFGVAFLRDAERLTADGDLLGTPMFMAPEQLRGLPATPASDLYAVGVMLHTMLTGENPFSKDTILAKALEDPPPPSAARPEVPPALDALVQRAMARSPSARFGTAAEFLAALAAIPASP
jgi:serine/threonine-protein kinase